MAEAHQAIKVVARRTGLSAHVIRIWEKRYGAVEPERTVTNRRLYSDEFCRRYAGEKRTCVHDADCSIRSLWTFLDRSVQRALAKTTLADLVCSEQEMTTWTRKNLEGAHEPRRPALPVSR